MDLFGFKRRKKEKEIIEKMDALQVAINGEAEKALEKVKEEWLEKVDKLKGNNIHTESLTKQSYIVQCEMGESSATLEIQGMLKDGEVICHDKPEGYSNWAVSSNPDETTYPSVEEIQSWIGKEYTMKFVAEPIVAKIHPDCEKLWMDRMIDVALSVSENKIMVKKEEELSYYKISNMEEFDGVFAYRLEKRHNGRVYLVAQGVTDRKSLDNYEKTGVFDNLFEYYLTNTARLHEILSKPNDYRFGGQSIYGDCFTVSPYDSGIVIDETGEYCLIKSTINQECQVEDYIGTYHPVGIVFDKNTGINNLNYDLYTMLKILKDRDDVKFNWGEYVFTIPSLGQREYYGRQIEELRFVWIPREEDLDGALDGDMFSHRLAVKNVFGIMEMYEQKEFIAQGRMLND